ncbi:MAG: dUTP diphosphatase, partial [Luminiphilus sp.]|nr:dUTP diphosphatase [Luminiphilus sp.]
AWIECGELMDHAGYKWWKHADPDIEQIQLEVVDIWHFGMSALLTGTEDQDRLANQIVDDLSQDLVQSLTLLLATEQLAASCVSTKCFSVSHFKALMLASDLDFDRLYRLYVGKNVLNFFRQDHGYKDGSYQKIWAGREDNEHLAEVLEDLDITSERFADQVYDGLSERYPA